MFCVRFFCCGIAVAIGNLLQPTVVAYILSLQGVPILLVFYCYVTFYYKVIGLKEHSFINSQICMSEVWMQCGWVFCSGYYQSEIKVSARLSSCLEALPALTLLEVLCSLQL